MLPAERRDVRQEIQRRGLTGFHPAGHDFAQFPAVPVDDDGGEQVERRDPVVLALAGAIADLAAPVETDRALERVVGFALVEADLDAAISISSPGLTISPGMVRSRGKPITLRFVVL